PWLPRRGNGPRQRRADRPLLPPVRAGRRSRRAAPRPGDGADDVRPGALDEQAGRGRRLSQLAAEAAPGTRHGRHRAPSGRCRTAALAPPDHVLSYDLPEFAFMPRIVSLIASATEIVCALGFEDQLVGRSHECDFPESVKRLPGCTEPKFDVHGSSRDIDERVKATLQEAASVYRIHADVLKQLRPDVLVTQSQCDVCAVSLRDVEDALCSWLESQPRVVSLAPNNLADVWDDLRRVAEALDVPERGQALVDRFQQ